jgi:hypothetical protein
VLSRPQTSKLSALEPISLEGARERFGASISEEELLLRLTMPAEQVDAMIAARGSVRSSASTGSGGGAVATPASPAAAPASPRAAGGEGDGRAAVVELVRGLSQRSQVKDFVLRKGDETVVWRRG